MKEDRLERWIKDGRALGFKYLDVYSPNKTVKAVLWALTERAAKDFIRTAK